VVRLCFCIFSFLLTYVLEESGANAGLHYNGSSGNRQERCVLGLSTRGPVAGFCPQGTEHNSIGPL
jgi:hypothetical protein